MKMSPVLRRYISELQKNIPFTVIPRRNKRSLNCVEIVLEDGLIEDISGKLNSKPEAERCGFWFMIRPLTRGRKQAYHHKQVYQLYLSPVHHVKKHRIKLLAITAAGFTPIQEDTARQRRTVSVAKAEADICRQNAIKSYRFAVSGAGELGGIEDILPDDICRCAERRNGIEISLRHPHAECGVFLPERLTCGD